MQRNQNAARPTVELTPRHRSEGPRAPLAPPPPSNDCGSIPAPLKSRLLSIDKNLSSAEQLVKTIRGELFGQFPDPAPAPAPDSLTSLAADLNSRTSYLVSDLETVLTCLQE